ncbi:YidB family protein [Mesorhizobium sp. ASY16-5R]|uniref:YidB family protein n=1 Tax=Mesorhizobium sp. ASY16-5R TaxID=3445772 RepID=UPI003FA0587A
MQNLLGKVLLGALGVILYKNRDRLADAWNPQSADPNAPAPPTGNPLEKVLGGGGLTEILDKFRGAGKGDAVDSWVGKGPNKPLDPEHVKAAIDEDTIAALHEQTGLSREEILERLAVNLPEAVDELTPDGQLPGGTTERAGDTLLDPVPPISPKSPWR